MGGRSSARGGEEGEATHQEPGEPGAEGAGVRHGSIGGHAW